MSTVRARAHSLFSRQFFFHLFPDFLKLCLICNLALPAFEAIIVVTRDNMNMTMHHFLPGCGLIIDMDINPIGVHGFPNDER